MALEWLNFHHLRYFWSVAHDGGVSRAAKRLRVSQPTVTQQVHALEESLGERLFRREGRTLALTEVGETVLRFADEIFSLGGELLDTVKGRPTGRPMRLAVGIADVVPKHVAYRILEPALTAPERVRLDCWEDTPPRLLAALASHALDVVISDAPAPPTSPAALADAPRPGGDARASRVYSHLLGECGVSLFGSPRLAAEMRVGFPRSLDGAPFLLPTPNTALRREIDDWFVAHGIEPRVVGEFQDAALLSVFAEWGAGLFAAPDAISPGGQLKGLRRVGALKSIRARYYAITVERRIAHPATLQIAGAAREKIFGAHVRRRPHKSI